MAAKAIPGYTLKKKLGEGAMASVFLAIDDKLQRPVALKVMSKKLLTDASFIERFLREARIVASISHRNIVTVFDVGSHNDFHYMAMELLPGGDMSERLKKGMPLPEAISCIIDIAKGLHYAGSKNLIHRDIKPDNIMFAEDGRAVITDFGIARDATSESEMTVVGSVIGTPQYMSPEQAGAKELDHRTDLYSLGIILFQILVGRPPYKGDSAIATGIMHINEPIPVLPMRYEQFQGFIDIALSKDPDNRFQSGEAFIEALKQVSLEERMEDSSATMTFSAGEMASASNKTSVGAGRMDFLADLSEEFQDEPEQLDSDAFGRSDSLALGMDSIDVPVLEKKAKQQPEIDAQNLSLESNFGQDVENGRDRDSVIVEPSLTRDFSTLKKLFGYSVLLFALIAGHIYYVNILGRQVYLTSAATTLTNFSHDKLGVTLNFYRVSDGINSGSRKFAKLTDDLIGDFLPKKEVK